MNNSYYQKKVSVIIPTYNRAKFIQNAVRSIMNQKYNNLEIIIVDDGSTDNTQAVVNSLKEKYSNIIYCHNERTKGPSGARNTGIIKSSGDYVSFLDSDDTWLDGNLSNGLKILNKYPEIDVLFGNYSIVDFDTRKHLFNFFDQKKTFYSLKSVQLASGIKLLKDNLFKALIQGNFFSFGTSIIRKSSINGILIDESITLSEDRDFVIQLYKKANATFAFREDPVFIAYKHDSNFYMSKEPNKELQIIEAHLYLFTKYLTKYNLSNDEKRILTKLIAKNLSNLSYLYGKNKEYQNALSFMLKSFKYGLAFRQLINIMKVIIILLISNVYISKMRSLVTHKIAYIRKGVSKIIELINRYIHPSHLAVFSRDLFKIHNQIHSNKDHLRAAMEWLSKSQDITGCGGSSAGYFFDKGGWGPPYPETTGYIIPTFLHYASLSGNSEYLEKAKKMGDWEIKIQLPSGAVRGGVGINEYPIVFNTGQVILGWTALYKQMKLNRFMDAAIKAADWLLTVQDNDGRWRKHTYKDIPVAYHTRVDWPLLEVYRHTNDEKYKNAAEKNILWVLSLAKENGWFSRMGFTLEQPPFTHTIAYTLRGLIESSFFLEEKIRQEVTDKVLKISEKIMSIYELRKQNTYLMPLYLPGTLNEKWNSSDNYSCLTGNAQIAILWLKIYGITNDARFLNAALKIIDQVKATQNLDSKNTGIRGGVAGSYPIWGKYQRFIYPNWATKFLADAIMLQESIMKKLEGTQI